ncbi:MAG: hypothetical protein GX814_00155 [Microbacteriaceae bacterium]|nr:hypothetical protein [Microbacteriaceae bacterium]
MELSLDIGSAILSVITAICIPFVVWWIGKSSREAEDDRKARADERAENSLKLEKESHARQLQAEARQLQSEARQVDEQAYREKVQRQEELKEVFEIHESLTQPQVFEALSASNAGASEQQYLVSLHARAAYRFKSFSDEFMLPENVVELVSGALLNIHNKYPKETGPAQTLFVEKVAQKQNHEKNEWVQDRIGELAARLTGTVVARGESARVQQVFQDLFASVRVTKGGQAVQFTLPGDAGKIWFSGSGRGDLPAGFGHMGVKGCTLRLMRRSLQEHNDSGAKLADEFATGIRDRAKSEPVCGCGIPLTFSSAPVAAVAEAVTAETAAVEAAAAVKSAAVVS